jgi:D-tyrosyl-tRNA(Tyr) deacylase
VTRSALAITWRSRRTSSRSVATIASTATAPGARLEKRSAPVKALVQRVSGARVLVEGDEISAIGPGLLVFLGVGDGDGPDQADRLADKVRALRIFEDADGRMNEPLGEREVLCVSQFTLMADTRKGNRPSYISAARPEEAEPLYERFRERLGAKGGVFGAMMAVELTNNGPVTLLLEA